MNRPFEVTLEYAGRDLRVKGSRTPYIPENKKGHPDTWSPAENSILEDIRISEMTPQGHYIPLDIKDENSFIDDAEFIEAVEAEL